MVPRVTRRLVRESPLTRALFREKMSVTRMEAIPKARPEPPPTTVMNKVPSTTPPKRAGINRATNTGKTWEVDSIWMSPLWYALSHGLEGGHLVGSDAVAPHIQADEDAGDADGRDEAGTEGGRPSWRPGHSSPDQMAWA